MNAIKNARNNVFRENGIHRFGTTACQWVFLEYFFCNGRNCTCLEEYRLEEFVDITVFGTVTLDGNAYYFLAVRAKKKFGIWMYEPYLTLSLGCARCFQP